MKTAGRRTPNRRAHPPSNRTHGAGDQNSSRLISWAAKQEKFQPLGKLFLLTSTFIEQIKHITSRTGVSSQFEGELCRKHCDCLRVCIAAARKVPRRYGCMNMLRNVVRDEDQ